MVYRVYVEKKPSLSPEAENLLGDLRGFLGVETLTGLRILNRYDVDRIEQEVYDRAKGVVFAEPQVDVLYDETFPEPRTPHRVLAVEALPGQFDQRADSCAQCIQLLADVERPLVAYAKVYLLEGKLSEADLEKIRHYVINPVESREASPEKPDTLVRTHQAPPPVATIEGFIALEEQGLNLMDFVKTSLHYREDRVLNTLEQLDDGEEE